MDPFNYTVTFLRSALAQDPFCLGDVDAEAVLRIESEFPELFDAEPLELGSRQTTDEPEFIEHDKPKVISKSNACPCPVAVGKKNLGFKCSLTPLPIQTSPKHHTCQSKLPVLQVPECSRGARCAALAVRSTHQPEKKGLNKFPLRKVQIPRSNLVVVANSEDKPNLIKPRVCLSARGRMERTPNAISSATASRANTSPRNPPLIIPPDPIKCRTRFYPKVKAQLTRSQEGAIETFIPAASAVRPSSTSSSKVSIPKMYWQGQEAVVLKSIKQQKGKCRAIPNPQPDEDFGNNVLNSQPNKKEVMQFLAQVKKQVKLEKIKVDLLTPAKAQSSLSRIHTSETEKVKVTKGCQTESRETSPSIASPTGFSSQKSKPCRRRSILIQNLAQKFEPTETEDESTQMIEDMQDDSMTKVEQLALAKMLAQKYEMLGRLKKKTEVPQVIMKAAKTTNEATQTERIEDIPKIPPHISFLEKIVQEFFRVEILKYIHEERARHHLGRKVDVGIETDPELQLTAVKEVTGPSASRPPTGLSTIDEETEVVFVTPAELPPPVSIRNPTGNGYETVETQTSPNVKDDNVKIVTPELTPSKTTNMPNVVVQKKAQNNMINDVTDCSSISDYTFSEEEDRELLKKHSSSNKDVRTSDKDVKTERESTISRIVQNKVVEDLVQLPTPVITGEDDNDDNDNERTNTDSESESADDDENSEGNTSLTESEEEEQIMPKKSVLVSRKSQTDKSSKHSRQRSRSNNKVSSFDLSSDLDTSLNTEVIKRLAEMANNDIMSEGEFLLTPHKSYGELSFSNSASPGIVKNGNANDLLISEHEDFYITVLGMDKISEEPSQNVTLSEGEAPTRTTTPRVVLDVVEHLLRNTRIG